ncbi:MAG: hypothetical protein Q7R90_04845 [bacterium]|nr:hypothetical protein [bacterium]
MRTHLGAASDSEILRTAFVELERKFGFPPLLAIADKKKKGSKK